MPCGDHRKQDITDRAHRYRAQQCAPKGRRRCEICGSTRFLTVDHRDGDEHNDRPSNLRWLCKSCNNAEGARLIRAGRGRRTRQYNRGAETYGEYLDAIYDHVRGEHDAGGKVIHETPKWKRQDYAGTIWARRKMRGNKKKKNPVLESLVAGAAAGTAAVLAGKYLEKRAGNRKRKRNQDGNGAAMYEDFHGRSAHEVLELQEQLLTAGDYAALGDDPEIWLRPVTGDPNNWAQAEIEFEPENGVKLATKDGSQLYFMGGDQSLPDSALEFFGGDTSKRFISLGVAYAISYVTEKKFDGFKRIPYAHILGEETGERPQLVYDTETKRVLLVGGAYSIAPVEGDLGASPGIVN